MTPVFTEDQLRAAVPMDHAALRAVADGFVAHAEGRVEMPPVMHLGIAEPASGDVDIKAAHVAGQPVLAVKIGAGFFSNRDLGLPSSTAMVVAISARTGQCVAVLLDNGYLTDVRTALGGALAARHLAADGPLRVALFGAGAQARYQVRALKLVREIATLEVIAPRLPQAKLFVTEMADEGVPAMVASDVEPAVRNADIIITTTPSRSPLFEANWLRPGQHITAVGSDLPGKQELSRSILTSATLIAADDIAQCRRIGELQHLAPDDPAQQRVALLGAILRGTIPGRRHADDITVADLTGLGVQDAAILNHALSCIGHAPQEFA